MNVTRRREWQKYAATQAVRSDPLHILDRVINVVQMNQANPGTARRILCAEFREPSVMRTRARTKASILFGGRRRRNMERLLVEGRDRVREDDLPDNTVAR